MPKSATSTKSLSSLKETDRWLVKCSVRSNSPYTERESVCDTNSMVCNTSFYSLQNVHIGYPLTDPFWHDGCPQIHAYMYIMLCDPQ